jgi:hypothetical protein
MPARSGGQGGFPSAAPKAAVFSSAAANSRIASDIAKRCLTAGWRGALADSGDVNCRWIPQVSQLMLRGVGHRRRGSSDLAGRSLEHCSTKRFPTRVRCSTPLAALLAWWCMTGRICRRRVAGRAARRVAAELADARRGRGAWLSPDSVAAAAYVVAVAQMPVSLEGARGVATDAAAVQVRRSWSAACC